MADVLAVLWVLGASSSAVAQGGSARIPRCVSLVPLCYPGSAGGASQLLSPLCPPQPGEPPPPETPCITPRGARGHPEAGGAAPGPQESTATFGAVAAGKYPCAFFFRLAGWKNSNRLISKCCIQVWKEIKTPAAPCPAVPTYGIASPLGEDFRYLSPGEIQDGNEKPKSRWESTYVEQLQILPKIAVKYIIQHLRKALGTGVQH